MLRKLLAAVLMAPLMALAQSYPSPTYQNVTVLGTLTGKVNSTGSTITNPTITGATITGGTISGLTSPLPVASGGTNSASASGTALDNITGFASTGFLTRTGAGTYAFQSLTNGITLGNLATQAANTVLANATGSTAAPTAFAMPSCNSASQALQWTSGSGFACNSAITTSVLNGTAAFTANPTIGAATYFPTVATNAALTALSTATTTTVTRLGYYAAGDTPPLTYTASGSACSLNSGAGDGGSQVASSNSQCWLADFGSGQVDVRWFGAKPDGATNDTTFMQAAHNTGKLIYYPAGQYNFTTISFAAGGIKGDGFFSILNSTDATSADIITFTGATNPTQVPEFRDFFLQDTNTKAGGAGIHINPSAPPIAFVHIHHIEIYNLPRSVQLTNADYGELTDSFLINYSDAGVYYEFPNNVAAGDFLIGGNHINTSVGSGNRYGIYQLSGGGLRISNNKILGGQSGYVLNYTATGTQSGPLLITGNSIENQTNFNIFLGTGGTGVFGGITITGNELGVNNGGAGNGDIWTDNNCKLTQLIISGNYMEINGAASTNMALNCVAGFNVGNNIIVGNSQAGNIGVAINSTSTNGKIAQQTYFNYVAGATTFSNASTSVFPDLTQQVTTTSVTTSTAYGSLFSGSAAVTFPVAFTNTPTVVCNAPDTGHGAVSAAAGGVTKTGFTLIVFGVTSGGATTGNVCVAQGVM